MAEERPLRDIDPRELPAERPERTFLGGMSLGTRSTLFLLFGLIIALALGFTLYDSDRRANAALEQLKFSQRIADLVSRIEAGALTLMANERDFVRSRDPRYAENYQKTSALVQEALSDIQALQLPDSLKKDISTIGDGIAQHAQQFEKVVETQKILGVNDDSGLARLVRVSADALAAKLADAKTVDMAARFSTIRQLERNMRTSPNRTQLARIETELGALKVKLSEQDMSVGEKTVIETFIDSYRADAAQLGRAAISLTREIGRLDEIDKYMAPSLAAIAAYSQRLVAINLARGPDAAQQLRTRIGGSVVIAVVLLILFGWVVMRTMARPMTRLAEATTRLVHGDRTVAIPARGNYDATGEMANALAYFRDNLVETDKLREELEEQTRTEAERFASLADDLYGESIPAEEDEDSSEPEADEFDAPSAPLPSGPEAETPAAIEQSISALSRRVTRTSQNASMAAHEAERTDLIIRGLTEAARRVAEVERMVASIKDQTSFLHVETNIRGGGENIVVLAPSMSGDDRDATLSAKDRIHRIQDQARRASNLIQETTALINEVKGVATDLAAQTSNEALEAATELLEQSENLRGMLDQLLGRLDPEDEARRDRDRSS